MQSTKLFSFDNTVARAAGRAQSCREGVPSLRCSKTN